MKVCETAWNHFKVVQNNVLNWFAATLMHLVQLNTILHGFSRFFKVLGAGAGSGARDRRGTAGPSPAELPSELRRVSEPARSEDLEDFNRNPLDFPRISSSAGAGPS